MEGICATLCSVEILLHFIKILSTPHHETFPTYFSSYNLQKCLTKLFENAKLHVCPHYSRNVLLLTYLASPLHVHTCLSTVRT